MLNVTLRLPDTPLEPYGELAQTTENRIFKFRNRVSELGAYVNGPPTVSGLGSTFIHSRFASEQLLEQAVIMLELEFGQVDYVVHELEVWG